MDGWHLTRLTNLVADLAEGAPRAPFSFVPSRGPRTDAGERLEVRGRITGGRSFEQAEARFVARPRRCNRLLNSVGGVAPRAKDVGVGAGVSAAWQLGWSASPLPNYHTPPSEPAEAHRSHRNRGKRVHCLDRKS